MQKNILISILVSITLFSGVLYFIAGRSDSLDNKTQKPQNIEIKDGVQYVTITAKGGYSPRVTEVQGGLPTKLVVKTNGTYDCSASLVVRSVDFQKILQPKGEEVIDLGIPKAGDKIQGVCGMGMYNFLINVR